MKGIRLRKNKSIYPFIILLILTTVVLLWKLSDERHYNDQFSPNLFTTSTTSSVHPPTFMEGESRRTSVAIASITELIETNGNCQFPCFWGITPGKTKWSDAINYFEQMDIPTERGITISNYEYLIILVDNNNVSFRVNIYKDVFQKEEFVAAIFVDISKTPGVMNDFSGFNYYSLKNIFTDFGIPTTLQFQIDDPSTYDTPEEEMSTTKGYSFWVVYEEIGVMMDYVGQFDTSVDRKICTENMANDIVLYLLSPQGFPPLNDVYTQPSELSDVIVLSELDKIDFYQNTLQTKETICFDFLANRKN